jgi:hypothetical protein
MTSREWSALQRLVFIALVWAAGETVLRLLGLGGLATFGGALLAVAAYFATRGAPPGRRRGGDVVYWRGRPIDRDKLN